MRNQGTLNVDFISVIVVDCATNSLTDFDLNFFFFFTAVFLDSRI